MNELLKKQVEISFFLFTAAFIILVIVLVAMLLLDIFDRRIVLKWRLKRLKEKAKQSYIKAKIKTNQLKKQLYGNKNDNARPK